MDLPPSHQGHIVAVFRRLFDPNRAQVCMLDLDGRILAVNESWLTFGADNGLRADYRFEGVSYLDVCTSAAGAGDVHARDALVGLLDIINGGRPKLAMTYPCHAPHERRWFKMWAETQTPEAPVIVIAHLLERIEPLPGVGSGVMTWT